MKYLIRIIPVVLLGLCFFQADAASQTKTLSDMIPEVVANVNGQPILGRELESLIRRELASIGNPEWSALRAEYQAALIYDGVTSLVNAQLLYEKAASSVGKATDDDVNTEMQTIAKNFSSDAEMNSALSRQFLDRESLKRKLGQDLTITKYVNLLAQAVTVAPEDISKFYAENPEMFAHPDVVRASHILLRSDEKSEMDARVKERAENLLDRAKKGEDFAKLAKENSEADSTAEGGDIGYAERESLDPLFADALFSMSIGDVRLVNSEYGYHVIKLTDKKKEGVAPLEDVREELANLLKAQKAQAELANLVNQLQEQANIEFLFSPGE